MTQQPGSAHHAGTARPSDQSYRADDARYGVQPYRRTGRSGLDLPAVSLGLWQDFGDDAPVERVGAVLRRAFDLGVTHIDLADDYGPPHGSAETQFGRVLAEDLAPYRDELVISTKAGYDMWPGPYAQGGGGRKHVLASLDQSLRRIGTDHIDVFSSHRDDPTTTLEETMGALDTAVRSGKALYAGISSYGVGCIAFSPLAQGLLTDTYLDGVPAGSRAARDGSLWTDQLTEQTLRHVRALDAMARARPEPGPDGARLGAARPAGDVGAGGGLERRAAGAGRRRHRGPRVQRGRVHRHRRARGRGGHRPVEDLRPRRSRS